VIGVSTMTEHEETHAGLREWAQGWYATEAAVELLIRSFGGRFASAGQPWVRHRPAGFWLDSDALAEHMGALSGGEQRVLTVVWSLASGEPLAEVASILAGVDQDNLTLILAAFSHASGSHEHTAASRDGGLAQLNRPGPLVPWPGKGVA
jgi:hypothetical protein